jgi:hypothetical protein
MQQQVAESMYSDRRECHQCGVTSYPHRMCRCRVCGLRHDSGCRQVQVLCAQCFSSTAPHNVCRCCRCGKIHSKRAGCRPLSALNIRRLPIDCQRAVLISRVSAEIRNALPPNSYCTHHLDIVSRIFMLQLRSLIRNIVKEQIFGSVMAYVFRKECQARGLPHAHMLFIVLDAVSAEFPDTVSHYQGWEVGIRFALITKV